jgi:hypothetical protein
VLFAAAAWIELQMSSGFDFMDAILKQLFESRNYLFPASFSSLPLSSTSLCKKLFVSVFFTFLSLFLLLFFSLLFPFSLLRIFFPLHFFLALFIYLLFVLADFTLFISSLPS